MCRQEMDIMYDVLHNEKVAIVRDETIEGYFKHPPFHPSQNYPEYPFGRENISASENKTYALVRNTLIQMKLDQENIGEGVWNPFKKYIKPGDTVVLKPNFVLDKHYGGGMLECVITQPDVIRAVCDYVYIALKGKGRLVIADAPQGNCDFENLKKNTKVDSIVAFYEKYADMPVELKDLRQTRYYYNSMGYLQDNSREQLVGDDSGYLIFNLGEYSELNGLAHESRIYGADYDRSITLTHHNNSEMSGKHEYCIAKTIMDADVIISMPKVKVHRKAGVTLNLKNMVGINGNKNYLPHYRIGLNVDGGDEYMDLTKVQRKVEYFHRWFVEHFLVNPNHFDVLLSKLERMIYFVWKKVGYRKTSQNLISAGDWYGNDTIWRTVLDLNKILLYGDRQGHMQDVPQRRFISIMDGIIGGENEGPLVPSPKKAGFICIGFNPLLADCAVARIMGFDINKIPKLKYAFAISDFPITDMRYENIEIFSNILEYTCAIEDATNRFLDFQPSKGWAGHIEMTSN